MKIPVFFSKHRKLTRFLQIVIGLILILVIVFSFIPHSDASTLKRVEQLTDQTQSTVDSTLASLGIVGTPTVYNGCSSDKYDTWLFGTEMDCESDLLYPSNFSTAMTNAQLANFPATAKKLDALFVSLGWKSNHETFAQLTPYTFASQKGVAVQNATYYREIGFELGDGDECDFGVSLTNPNAGTVGAVLNLLDFGCTDSISYPQLNL